MNFLNPDRVMQIQSFHPGHSVDEIKEMMIHLAHYAGYPRAGASWDVKYSRILSRACRVG